LADVIHSVFPPNTTRRTDDVRTALLGQAAPFVQQQPKEYVWEKNAGIRHLNRILPTMMPYQLPTAFSLRNSQTQYGFHV